MADVFLDLTWEGELRFGGRAGDVAFALDSAGAAGLSPMQALGAALAGCMAIDIVHILTRGRQDLRALRASLVAHRAETEPRRFTRIVLHFTVEGALARDHVERAVALSRETYCSVWHSLRQDIELDVTYGITSG